MRQTIKGKLDHFIFHSSDTGYSVIVIVQKDGDKITATGCLPDNIANGASLLLTGEMVCHPKYGNQLKIEHFEEMIPTSEEDMIAFLGSGIIKGLGPSSAGKIVRHFGRETFDILDVCPDRLTEVKGVGRATAKKVGAAWEEQKRSRAAISFLLGYGITINLAAKIYKQYGDSTIQTVRKNPYSIADDVWGVGFKKADEIAANIGYPHDGYERCSAGIIFALKEIATSGSTFAIENSFVEYATELLAVTDENIYDALNKMSARHIVKWEDGRISLPVYDRAETKIALNILRILKARASRPVDGNPDLKTLFDDDRMEFDPVQEKAVKTAANSKFMVLTGGPGTGKTTITKAIINVFRKQKRDVLLAAPTGRAAKRMSEATGLEAITIHRLLEYGPNGTFGRNKDNPLIGDALVIDECSMIDTLLMNALMDAIPDGMCVYLVGDVDQLPSVGAGNVLHDIINSGVCPVVKLTRIFRQAMESRIVMNAHQIINGNMPNLQNSKDGDFFFMTREDPSDIAATVSDLASVRLPEYYNLSQSDVQVLSPMKKGPCGTDVLNRMIQQASNPYDGYSGMVKRGDMEFHKGDRVMQLKNDYDKNVFNGDIGTVAYVKDGTLYVRFEESGNEEAFIVPYDQKDLVDLSLAYACTVHKSQGSEYPIVVIPVTLSHYIMLQRNLLYTAVTRAKQRIVLVGTKKAVMTAVHNAEARKRNTMLCSRLNETFAHTH